MASQKPTAAEKVIAARLLAARNGSSLTKGEAAKAVGVTWQQLGKYESGTNRVSAGRLLQLATIYGKPIMYFYDGLDQHVSSLKQGHDSAED